MTNETMTRAGFRHIAGPTDPQSAPVPARLTELGQRYLRRRRQDEAPFIPLQVDALEAQWGFLVDAAEGAAKGKAAWRGSVDAAKYALRVLRERLRTQGRVYHEEVKHEGRVFSRRRVAFDEIGLPSCECTGGAQHHDVCADELLGAVRELMQEVVSAPDAEEAHAAAMAADALLCVLANHGVQVAWGQLWREVCPPATTTVSAEEAQRIRPWDNRWKVTAEDPVTGEVTLTRDMGDRFQRAMILEAEEEARRQARPLLPPAGWQPPTPREGDIEGVDGVTAAQ